MTPLTKATIIDTIVRILHNGPDNPSPKIEHIIRKKCKSIPSNRVLSGYEMDNVTYNSTLEFFESKNLFTYDDLSKWIERHILTLPPL